MKGDILFIQEITSFNLEKLYIYILMNLNVLVVGAGGNGQTYFMQFLKKHQLIVNHITDQDKLKHMSHPNKIPKNIKIKRCIFLYNNPYDSIHSHYRRKWYKVQINKLGNPYKINCANINNINTYNEYCIKHNKDIFGIEYQFDNWFEKGNTNIPILFLDFNDILNKKDIIDNFLGKKLNYNLFEVKERSNKEYNKEVTDIYDKLYDKIKSLTINN
jgi:hypothetical protein